MYDRMVREHGYSIRKLADKLGKDKGYLENRLRLADAPPEVRELVSLRKDTLSHAYELMKVEDPKKRRRLAAQVARGELTLVKLRDKIEGRRTRPALDDDVADDESRTPPKRRRRRTDRGRGADAGRRGRGLRRPAAAAPRRELAGRREAAPRRRGRAARRRPRDPGVRHSIPDTDRANLAKYLTISKLKLENVDRDGPERRPAAPDRQGWAVTTPSQPTAEHGDPDRLELPGPFAAPGRRPVAHAGAHEEQARRPPRPRPGRRRRRAIRRPRRPGPAQRPRPGSPRPGRARATTSARCPGGRHRRDPRGPVPLEVRPGIGDREHGAGEHGGGDAAGP